MATFVAVLFILICILLIVVVLLQKGRGGGLGATFGGIGSSAFGTRVGDVFTWVTIVLTALFLLTAVAVVFFFRADRLPAPPPTFIPAAQQISQPLDVTIQIEGLAGAEVRYTADGSDPTQQSPLYENVPVRIEPGTTLKARTYAPNRDPSQIVEAHYPPAAQLQADGATQPADQPETAPAGPEEQPEEPTTQPLQPVE